MHCFSLDLLLRLTQFSCTKIGNFSEDFMSGYIEIQMQQSIFFPQPKPFSVSQRGYIVAMFCPQLRVCSKYIKIQTRTCGMSSHQTYALAPLKL